MTPQGDRDSSFFFFYAATLLVLVLMGFAPSFFARFLFDKAPLPLYLHVHGAILTGWFLLLLSQSWLIRRRLLVSHRRYGAIVSAYAVLVTVGALMATLNMMRREVERGVSLELDMADVYPEKAGGISFLEFSAGIVWFNLAAVLIFSVLVALAVAYRRRGDFHKRFVTLASLSMLPPALARLSRIEMLGSEQGPFIPVVMLALLLALLVYDYRSLGTIHRATAAGIGLMVALNVVAGVVATHDYGIAFVRNLA